MYAYVVHVCRPGTRRWEILGTDERQRDIPVRGYQAQRVSIDSNLHADDGLMQYSDMETWYFEDKNSAEVVARKFSREKAGRQVFLLELRNVFQATVGETVKMNYTEKGLVPA